MLGQFAAEEEVALIRLGMATAHNSKADVLGACEPQEHKTLPWGFFQLLQEAEEEQAQCN